jgi:hypothetical protein
VTRAEQDEEWATSGVYAPEPWTPRPGRWCSCDPARPGVFCDQCEREIASREPGVYER